MTPLAAVPPGNPEAPEGPVAARDGAPNGNGAARSAVERAASDEPMTQDELFVYEQGRKVTLGTLIARGTVTKYAFVFGGKRVKAEGSLLSLEEDVLVVCRGRVGSTKIVPKRDETERVTEVTIETHIRAIDVAQAASDKGRALIAQATPVE